MVDADKGMNLAHLRSCAAENRIWMPNYFGWGDHSSTGQVHLAWAVSCKIHFCLSRRKIIEIGHDLQKLSHNVYCHMFYRPQCLYKPTGTTTDRHTQTDSDWHRSWIQYITRKAYVCCVFIDTIKTVDHNVLVAKLCRIDLPDFVLRCIINF